MTNRNLLAEERRVNDFFAKMRVVWGNGAYNQQFGTPEDLRFAKREFYNAILKPTDEELTMAFDHARKMIGEGDPDWRYPHVERILEGAKRYISPSHRLLPPPVEHSESKKKAMRENGKHHIQNLKNLFN